MRPAAGAQAAVQVAWQVAVQVAVAQVAEVVAVAVGREADPGLRSQLGRRPWPSWRNNRALLFRERGDERWLQRLRGCRGWLRRRLVLACSRVASCLGCCAERSSRHSRPTSSAQTCSRRRPSSKQVGRAVVVSKKNCKRSTTDTKALKESGKHEGNEVSRDH